MGCCEIWKVIAKLDEQVWGVRETKISGVRLIEGGEVMHQEESAENDQVGVSHRQGKTSFSLTCF